MEIVRSVSKRTFVKSLQKLIPEVTEDDFVPKRSGVRAHALMPDGKLVDDFLIVTGKNSIHVCNAPSPAATASLEIGCFYCESASEGHAGSEVSFSFPVTTIQRALVNDLNRLRRDWH